MHFHHPRRNSALYWRNANGCLAGRARVAAWLCCGFPATVNRDRVCLRIGLCPHVPDAPLWRAWCGYSVAPVPAQCCGRRTMSPKQLASWILTFGACVGMVVAVLVGIGLLLSIPPCEPDRTDDVRMRYALAEAKHVALVAEATVGQLGPPGAEAGYDEWTTSLCESLTVADTKYKALSEPGHPNPQGYYVAVMQPTFSGRPAWFTYTILVKAIRRDEFTLVVARIPEFQTRHETASLMIVSRWRSGPQWRGQFVAKPEFWRQREPDLLGAFPGRSIDADPLPRFFERFGKGSQQE